MVNPHPSPIMFGKVSEEDDIKQSLDQLGPMILGSKIEQQTVVAQSALAGGPTDNRGAILNLMDVCKIKGYRALSLGTGIKRKKLQEMIEGTRPMTPEVISQLWSFFQQRRPDLPWF